MDLVSAAVPMVLRTGAARPLATIGCTSSPRGLAEVHVARTESCCLLGNFSAGRGHGRRNCGTTNHLSGWVELDGRRGGVGHVRVRRRTPARVVTPPRSFFLGRRIDLFLVVLVAFLDERRRGEYFLGITSFTSH